MNPTFRADVAVEMEEWCRANCTGEFEVIGCGRVHFEKYDDYARFERAWFAAKI